jgi:hypothetical protein
MDPPRSIQHAKRLVERTTHDCRENLVERANWGSARLVPPPNVEKRV